ncbi:MAG: hypothetical protein GY696_35690 [Gammaproteobacteria bacterium]|nr:hypothetical protein [Gammaproteobacteria bacterium]
MKLGDSRFPRQGRTKPETEGVVDDKGSAGEDQHVEIHLQEAVQLDSRCQPANTRVTLSSRALQPYEEQPNGTEPSFSAKLRALQLTQVHKLGIYRTQKCHRVLNVHPNENNSPGMRAVYVGRLGAVVTHGRQFLKSDAIMDTLATDLENDSIWKTWSRGLTAEEKVHVRLVQDSRSYARGTISAAEEYLAMLADIVQRDRQIAERRAMTPYERNPYLSPGQLGSFEGLSGRRSSEPAITMRRTSSVEKPPVVRFARTRSGGFKRLDLSTDSSSGSDNCDGGPDQSASVRTQPNGWIRIVRPSEDNPKEWVMETIYGQPQGAEKRVSQVAQTVTRVVQKLKVGLDQGDPGSSYEPTEMPGLSPDAGVPSGAQ